VGDVADAPDMETKPRLHVLILEDSPVDAQLVSRVLAAAGFELDVDVAATGGRFEELLADEAYDVILADYSLPGFDAHAALELAATACPETPFICVSGTIGEEATVELLKQGADDCVLKDHLTRLPFAVQRAIDEKTHARALRESERRYHEVLEFGGVGVAYYSTDGRILLLNRRAVQNLGGSDSGQFVGKHLTELFGEEAGRMYVERIREAAASPEPREYVDRVELPIGLRWLDSIHTRSLNAAGDVVGVHVYAQDITDRKRAEEAATEAASQWRETFDAMADSIALFDEGGKVLRCNAATTELTGRGFEDIVGRPCHEVFHGTLEVHPLCPQRRAFESGQTETSTFAQHGRWLREGAGLCHRAQAGRARPA
jgi:PAS domain S-box-containing protein